MFQTTIVIDQNDNALILGNGDPNTNSVDPTRLVGAANVSYINTDPSVTQSNWTWDAGTTTWL